MRGRSLPSRAPGRTAWRHVVAALVLLLPPLGHPASADHPAAEPAERKPGRPTDQDRLDALVRPYIEEGTTVGLVVGILDHDRRTIRGYGRISVDDPTPPDGSTVFDIASLTKGFTMVLTHHAARQGELALGDPVDRYLPPGVTAPRKGGRPILVRHLMEHSSGLPRDYVPAERRKLADPFTDYPLELLYEGLGEVDLAFAPGADLGYSNYGYALLGQVLARASGRSYDELLDERITGPLGMEDTGQRLTDSMRRRLAPGYDVRQRPRPRGPLGALEGAVGVCSTARDLLRFARAVNSPPAGDAGASIRNAFLSMMPPASDGDRPRSWSDLPDDLRMGSAGRTFGYKSTMILYPNRKWALVLLANSDSPTLDRLAWRIADTLGPKGEARGSSEE